MITLEFLHSIKFLCVDGIPVIGHFLNSFKYDFIAYSSKIYPEVVNIIGRVVNNPLTS